MKETCGRSVFDEGERLVAEEAELEQPEPELRSLGHLDRPGQLAHRQRIQRDGEHSLYSTLHSTCTGTGTALVSS